MTWDYAYTPYIQLPLFTAVLLLTLSVYSWHRRCRPGAVFFSIGCLLAGLWSTGSVMEHAAVDVATKIFWVKFQGVWKLPAITATTCFVLEYTSAGRWLTRRNLARLSIPPLLALGLILTNDLHHVVWDGFGFDGSVIPFRGPGNWMFVAYG